jgi:hypothetical protein
MEVFMKAGVAIVLLVAVVGTDSAVWGAGGDTDAVIARGLFPLSPQHSSLRILRTTVRVILGRDGITTRREYVIQNTGADARAVRLATICGREMPLDGECGEARIDGAQPTASRSIGYLVDKGSHVAIRPKTRRQIEECLKTVDGEVCGHEWIEFAVDVRAGETLNVTLQYPDSYKETYWIESVTEPLYLYTEKFWAGDSVPQVAVWVQVRNGRFALGSWTPRGLHSQYSTPPSRAVGGAILWQLDGYRPVKKDYTYKFRLLHPWSVDRDQIRRVYDEAARSSGTTR